MVIDVGGYDPKRPIIQASGSYVLEFRGKLRGYRIIRFILVQGLGRPRFCIGYWDSVPTSGKTLKLTLGNVLEVCYHVPSTSFL